MDCLLERESRLEHHSTDDQRVCFPRQPSRLATDKQTANVHVVAWSETSSSDLLAKRARQTAPGDDCFSPTVTSVILIYIKEVMLLVWIVWLLAGLRKIPSCFTWSPVQGWSLSRGRTHYNLGQIQITGHSLEYLFHFLQHWAFIGIFISRYSVNPEIWVFYLPWRESAPTLSYLCISGDLLNTFVRSVLDDGGDEAFVSCHSNWNVDGIKCMGSVTRPGHIHLWYLLE